MNFKKQSPREIVFFILKEIFLDQHSLGQAEELFLENLSHSERSWAKAFVYGFLRIFFSLENLAKSYLTKPLKSKDQDVFLILLMGLYETRFMNTAKHAAVFETVGLLDGINKTWAKGLINACLRKDLREIPELKISYGPLWWEKNIKKYYPGNYLKILENSQKQAPIFLRINTQKIAVLDYLKLLENLNILGAQISNQYLQLNSACDIRELPGFSEGWFYVQDISLQYVPELLKLSPDLKILDACAAPGGKSLHLLETEPSLDLICLDSDSNRLERLKENFQRFNLIPKILCADGENINFEGPVFDRILLDAPCSATGVIRRHPDILLLRRESDLLELAETQLKILNNLSQYLKPNSYLLYTTCSVLNLENDDVIKKFLKQNPSWISESISLPVGQKTYLGWQILPGENPEQNGDGFYYAVLKNTLSA